MEEHFKKYYGLREEIDKKCSQLWQYHKQHMNCRMGCSSCCQSFKILPIEFKVIEAALKDEDVAINHESKPTECKFLINGSCSIYNYRPIICRTHGYPLFRLNDEVEAYEVTHCPLNFKNFPFDNFNQENMFPEDTFNSKLFLMNKAFVRDLSEEEYGELELVELNKLF